MHATLNSVGPGCCSNEEDICRVCRSQGTPESPLYFPCACAGSMKYIHNECLMQWIKYSKTEVCEVCTHRFSFNHDYSTDLSHNLKDVLLAFMFETLKLLWYCFIIFLWLGILPLFTARIFIFLFNGSFDSVLRLPVDLVKIENLSDIIFGWCIVLSVLFLFSSLVWLHDSIYVQGRPSCLNQQHRRLAQVLNLNNAIEPGVDGQNLIAYFDEHEGETNRDRYEENEFIGVMYWVRVLGFDGTSFFCKTATLALGLLTGAIIIFVFCPYICGKFVLTAFDLPDYITSSPFSSFEGILNCLTGYVIFGYILALTCHFFSIFGLFFLNWHLHFSYLVVKVLLLLVVVAVIFPMFCGFWVDLCTMPLLGRMSVNIVNDFKSTPKIIVIIYWVLGFNVIYVFSWIILLLRDIFRHRFFWFFPHLYDSEFRALHNLIVSSVLKQVKELFLSLCIFITVTWLVIWLPVWCISEFLPSFLPYNLQLSSEMIIRDLSLENIILQIFLPFVFDKKVLCQLLKSFISGWFYYVSNFFHIHYFFFEINDELEQRKEQETNEELDWQQLPDEALKNSKYEKPSNFSVRILLLLAFACFSMTLCGFWILFIPVLLGRTFLCGILGKANIHDIYTISCGLSIIWLGFRLVLFLGQKLMRK